MYAHCYGGHQFGNVRQFVSLCIRASHFYCQWAGQLGDGRASNFGEVMTDQELKWEIQLKVVPNSAVTSVANCSYDY